MKILISDVIRELDENIIENLIWDKQDKVKVSKFKLKWKIRKEINKKTFWYKITLNIICLILFISIIPITAKAAINFILNHSAIVSDFNRDLIGTEITDKNYIIYSNGTYKNSNGDVIDWDELARKQEKIQDNRIIKEIQQDNFSPSSIVEVIIDNISKNSYSSPEILLVNNSACILTKEDGSGFNLKKGDTLEYNFEKYKSNVVEEQTLIIGYVKDGVMYQGKNYNDLKDSYILEAQEEGEYFIYLLSASSDYLTLKQGKLIQAGN